MRILIVKLGSIGDIIHTLPSLAAIRRAFPDANISWVVEENVAEMLRGNALIDNLIEVDTKSMRGGMVIEEMLLGLGKQIRNLRKFKFDIAIDFQGLWKSATIAKLSGARHRWGFSRDGLREASSRVLLTDTVAVPSQINIIHKNLALASGALGFPTTNEIEFPIATKTEHISEAEEIIARTGGNFAILNPGGGWVTKLWHAEKFGRLADRLWEEKGLMSVVATGPRETELARTVAANSNSGRATLAQPSLKGFYELAKKARVYVGGDTGPTHIAIAAGTPVVGIFGPTEWWRNGSPFPADIVVERSDIDCRFDCHRRTCGKWICMDIETETVFDAVSKRLANN
ncbi:MAG: lipopolysaccharide heptosyltransferase I [Acidobacteria bacterium]|nr:lipopolysaccharide heptosyltransferase I [Acidobacteriota bacterium]MBP7474436.1 lipopolysaccharide heptosyltransferase I [Pyrinomonadaceae bacterium]